MQQQYRFGGTLRHTTTGLWPPERSYSTAGASAGRIVPDPENLSGNPVNIVKSIEDEPSVEEDLHGQVLLKMRIVN